ncbi:MAG: glycoside hydrolase family 2 [Kiritimatiellae bacterium]|nr:glycoside hydrolase family 2 [Kiritimatiellia bacterium]
MERLIGLIGLLAASVAWGTTVPLDGTWRLDYFPQPLDGAVRTVPLAPAVGAKTVSATVPGNCELDLVNAGILPPLEVGLNVLKLRPYEAYQWLYTKEFVAPAVAVKAGEKAELVFGGIDTLADVFLNGEKVGESANMLIEHRFDVTRKLRTGTNVVQVLLRPVMLDTRFATVGEMGGASEPGADGERYRKAAHMGGWDIAPRVYAQGLWRSVSLEIQPPVRLKECVWMLKHLDVKSRRADYKFRCRLEAPFSVLDHARLRCTLSRKGQTHRVAEFPVYTFHPIADFTLANADLWWPRGSVPATADEKAVGEAPALYDAVAEIVAEDGTVLARDARKIGVRTIVLKRDDVYSKERPGQFLFVVNDEPIYVRGSNWVPLDAFHGRDRSHLIPTLEMWKDLNCNMVRVWGGGVYEPDEFFDWCDANGIMVWQDFMTGCGVFPQDDDYARATREEVLSIVLRHRNHPSLALWSGNNENDGAFSWFVGWTIHRNPNQDRSSRQTIPNVLFEYDLTRPYLPSSPYFSPDVVAGKAKPSEDHLWGARAYYKVAYYTNSPCWFASEMGYHGCPNLESLKKMMTPACVAPWKEITGTDPHHDFHWNDEWQLKACNAGLAPGVMRHGTRNNLMTNQTKIMFGGVAHDVETFVAQSQFVQAEAMKTFCEMFRSRKFTRFNGLIWWNVRDCWPIISDAVVDYYGGKKKAYYALRNVQGNQLVLLGDDHVAWAVNDRRYPVKGHAVYTDKATGRVLFEGDYTVPANGKTRLGNIPFSGQGLIEIRYSADGEVGFNHFLYGEPPFKWSDVQAWTRDSPLYK